MNNEPLSRPVYTVQVRELIEFVLRQGDLGGERQFVGSDRALAGIRGHQKIQGGRPAGYQAEVPVEHNVEEIEFILKIDKMAFNIAQPTLITIFKISKID